eukprot:8645341-Lingulodinium_polyedra.AAC.1
MRDRCWGSDYWGGRGPEAEWQPWTPDEAEWQQWAPDAAEWQQRTPDDMTELLDALADEALAFIRERVMEFSR